ncbi:phage tail protein [Acidocella sp. MX-AZ02]|uniref:phage tail protein n=1 Tax=Acidocella sp. MX-AZ02 TaxID=1214225 RepID=UPI000A016F35|nr:phage tail protein [Acidocella sp. MX-AZ02]
MPQMILGSFLFSLNTAAFQELQRNTEYTWAAVPRFSQNDALQFTGPGQDMITLPGVVYPGFRGGGGQLNALRALAGQGKPQSLIDGMGNVYGRWVITGVAETQSIFAAFGQPKKQAFTVTLRWYDGGPSSLLTNLLNNIGLGGLVSSAQSAQQTVEGLTGIGNLI